MAALHQAALVGNVDIMKLLLDSGAAVDIRDSKGGCSFILFNVFVKVLVMPLAIGNTT